MKRGLPSVVHDHLSPRVVYAHRVGKKCVVNFIPDSQGEWLEMGGVSDTPRAARDPKSASKDKISPEGLAGVDPHQSRIYYRAGGLDVPAEVRVFLPQYIRFRRSRKGLTLGRSKSFDERGFPVPQVRLLYALKSDRHDDRVEALMGYPQEFWIRWILEKSGWDMECEFEVEQGLKGITFGSIFGTQAELAQDARKFRVLVGREMARCAERRGGMADWALWEKVADEAILFNEKRMNSPKDRAAAENHILFVRAVKETTAKLGGLPAQIHVQQRWEELDGEGEWREVRKTLGFEWLPTKVEWDKGWKRGIT